MICNDIKFCEVIFCFYVQVCHSNPSERSRFIRCIYNLLSSGSLAVRYEAAGTLVTLSNAPSAIKVGTNHSSFSIVMVNCYAGSSSVLCRADHQGE